MFPFLLALTALADEPSSMDFVPPRDVWEMRGRSPRDAVHLPSAVGEIRVTLAIPPQERGEAKIYRDWMVRPAIEPMDPAMAEIYQEVLLELPEAERAAMWEQHRNVETWRLPHEAVTLVCTPGATMRLLGQDIEGRSVGAKRTFPEICQYSGLGISLPPVIR